MPMTLLLLASLVTGHKDSVSIAHIQREYAALVRIVSTLGPNGRDSVQLVDVRTDSLPSQSLLAGLLSTHGQMVWYLASHTPGAETRMVGRGSNAAAVRDSAVSALRNSAAFNDRLLAMLSRYWETEGRSIANYSKPFTPVEITTERLNQVAARFFYPDHVTATGDTIMTHICAGVNGLRDLPEPVDPLVEALAFVAVRGEVFRPGSALLGEFRTAMKRAKVTSASADVETRIRRAQGALWVQLEGGAALPEALAAAYQREVNVLPLHMARY